MKHKLQGIKEESQALCADASSKLATSGKHLEQIAGEYHRVTELSYDAPGLIENLDRDFEKRTRLTGTDIGFLFVAVALQCMRQYILTLAPVRLGDKEAAKKVKPAKEHSDRSHRLYNPSLEEIQRNPVPFDANRGSKNFSSMIDSKKMTALKGFGALGHRGATPGHDPILGLVVGTANIATSTLTTWRAESFHIATKQKYDTLSKRAKTSLVFSHSIDKLLNQGMDGKIIIGVSVAKEIQHLRSDLYSKDSLPLPVVSVIDPKLAGELAKRGLDMANVVNVGKQFTYAAAIDTLIAIIHGLFYRPDDGAWAMHEVRTRRILLYSNLIASASNVVVSAVTAYCGGNAARIIDWGGYLNTLRHIAFDLKFIREVKRDFLKNELYKLITGEQYDFMEGEQ